MRYFLDIIYNGTRYHGWQFQKNAVSVQQRVQEALFTLLRQEIEVYGAGRTDAGVHAISLPSHFNFDQELHPAFLKAINSILPEDIAVRRVWKPTDPDLHARFAATSRSYRYQMIFGKDPLLLNLAYHYKGQLDLEAMMAAAEVIKEYDSFESFCKANAQNKTYFCTIMDSHFEWEGNVLVYHVKANRFLRGMVRTIMGTLLMVGEHKIGLDGVREIIEAKDRRKAGPAVPACGLFLAEVKYPVGSFEEIDFRAMQQEN